MMQLAKNGRDYSNTSRRRGRRAAPRPYLSHTLETLEPRTLLTSSPTGSVDVFTRTTIAGWAVNVDDAPGAINVEITINGSKSVVKAVASRPDLISLLGSPYHGYSYTVPTLSVGNSTVLVEAVSASTGARTTLKSGTLVNPTPVGSVDVLTANHIAGWAVDPDSSSPIQVRVDVDGVTGSPFTTSVARPDVASIYHVATAGFDLAGSFAGHVVEVYGVDSPSGQTYLLYSNNKLPKGNVDVNNSVTVAGWAYDPDNASASINVRVAIDGVTLAGTPLAANLSRPDLVSFTGSANHGYSVAIPGLTPGSHTISVYALDGQSNAAAPVLLGSTVVNNPAPIGRVDLINTNTVTGWALDPDMGAGASTVNVYVDDSLFATVKAALPRPDIGAAYGTPNHGFSVNLSSLPAGSHSVTVTVMDNRVSNENEVVIYDDFINNHAPIGSFDAFNGTKIFGWAYDQDAGGNPIEVDVYVDGTYVDTTTANLARPDIDSFLGSPNHAFAANMPVMSFGTHVVDIYAAESQGNVSVLIGSKQVTNSRPIGSVDVLTPTLIQGWAADPDRPGVFTTVQVFVNGTLATYGAANITRSDLSAIPNPAGGTMTAYGYSLGIGLPAGRNQVDVYAVDLNNGMLSPLASKVLVV